MPVSVQMPKQGNTVEECLLVEWKIKEGDTVKVGDVLCSIETDKASFDVESTADGVILKLLAKAGDLVPVLSDIAIVGQPGEKADTPASPAHAATAPVKSSPAPAAPAAGKPAPAVAAPATQSGSASTSYPVSPRARKLAEKYGFQAGDTAGTGINGRVTSHDVQALVDSGALPRPTPLAKEIMATQGLTASVGSGIGGMVRARDLAAGGQKTARPTAPEAAPEVIPFKGIRKLIGDRMLQSLMDHAQLTLNSSADATSLMAIRSTIKAYAEAYGLPQITLNDMICWVVAQTLPSFPEVNAVFNRSAATITRYGRAHLGVAVDTPRGLMVPVVTDAHKLSLAEMSRTIAKYAEASRKGSIQPDLLSGGTFTITNLGTLGIETFTPVLNSPQVAILGVCAIVDTPVKTQDGGFKFQPRMGLSLTIDHQVVDGAPGARFLQAVAKGIENIQASLALLGAL